MLAISGIAPIESHFVVSYRFAMVHADSPEQLLDVHMLRLAPI